MNGKFKTQEGGRGMVAAAQQKSPFDRFKAASDGLPNPRNKHECATAIESFADRLAFPAKAAGTDLAPLKDTLARIRSSSFSKDDARQIKIALESLRTVVLSKGAKLEMTDDNHHSMGFGTVSGKKTTDLMPFVDQAIGLLSHCI